MIRYLAVAGQKFSVKYTEDPSEISSELEKQKPWFFTYDTETTGLHIKKDRPFLGAICFNNSVFVFPTKPSILSWLPYWSSLVQVVFAHNTTFDMHMTANGMRGVAGLKEDKFPLQIKNWGDTQCLARLVVEAKSVRHGGDKIALKYLGKKYIDPNADQWEKAVKAWLKAKETQDRKILTAILHGIKDEQGRKWTIKRMEEALRDGAEWLPQEVLDAYQQWRHHYPKPTYQDVPMDIMLPYVATDVILEKLLVDKAIPVIEHKEQIPVMKREFRLIPIVYKMERVGLKVDREYLEECNKKLDDYIKDLYTELHLLTGIEFTVGQHQVIKKMYTDLLGEEPKSTDKKFLKKMADKGDRVAEIITRLRRLEKWKETYIERILKVSEYDGRFYTQLNPYNPVSGRFSGDSQQFPKDPIYTEEGYRYEKENPGKVVPDEYVLYHPRRAFVGHIYYLDYSQVELRVQGHYTLYFGGDLNLCRAYMPFKCVHYKTGEKYDYTTKEQRKRWSELREGAPTNLHWEDALAQGWSVWINPDTGQPWCPTDIHTMTTLKALVAMGFDPEKMDKKDIAWWRKKGKQFNFMRNYGGGDEMAAATLDISIEQARALNRGYTESFPLVVTYQDAVIRTMRSKGFAVNMYGRRYYLSDWNKHYTVANYLIQGTCADMLKIKMIEIDDFITQNGLEDKLAMVLCVHDELQIECYDQSAEWAIWKIKEIMEDTPDILVPIVAEVEYTTTSWAEKRKLTHAA